MFSAYIQLTLTETYVRGYLFQLVASLYVNCLTYFCSMLFATGDIENK